MGTYVMKTNLDGLKTNEDKRRQTLHGVKYRIAKPWG